MTVFSLTTSVASSALRLLKICMLLTLLCAAWSGLALAQDGKSELAEPKLPIELLDTGISKEVLAYQLIPLTKAELEQLGMEWLQVVRTKTEEVSDKQVALIRNPDLATDAAYTELAMIVEERAGLLERFTMIVDSLQSKGGDQELISELRSYRDSVLFNETMLASPKAIAGAFLTWLTRSDGGLAVLWDIVIVVLSFAALLFVSRSARSIAGRWIGKMSRISNLLKAFLVGAVYWLVLVVGLIFVLAALGVNITPLFAMIGGASFILAFAFQDTLGNLASGLMIMINRPFDEGDYVLVGGVGGTVKSVNIVATTVTTPDNQVIVIPNKNVWGNVITNVTASETRRVDLVFGISYEDSIPEALKVIEKTVRAHPLVLDEPEPNVRVHELAASSVNFICRPWTKTSDYWTVYWDLTHTMKEAFSEAGISIPYPQQDLHIKTQEPPQRLPSS